MGLQVSSRDHPARRPDESTRQRAYTYVALIALTLSLLGVWALRITGESTVRDGPSPPQWSTMAFSDFLILMAADRFLEDGVIASRGLAEMTVGYPEFSRGWYAYQTDVTGNAAATRYYTHYGAVDAMVVASLQALGVKDLTTLYRTMAAMSLAALAVWSVAAWRLFGRAIAAVSTLVMGTSTAYLLFFETITAHVYDPLFAHAALACFTLAWTRAPDRRSMLYSVAGWLSVFLLATNSPEFVVFVLIALVGFRWALVSDGRRLVRYACIVFGAALCAQTLHFAQVALLYGSLGDAVQDIVGTLHRRTVGFELAVETGYQSFSLTRSLSEVEAASARALGHGIIGLHLMLAAAIVTLRSLRGAVAEEAHRQLLQREERLLVVLFVGGIAFWLLMLQATVTSAGTVYRTALPFLGVASGVLIVRGVELVGLASSRRLGVVVLLLSAALLSPIAQRTVNGRLLRPSELRHSWSYYGMHPAELVALADLLGERTPFGSVILSNIDLGDTGHPDYPFPAIEYYSGRRVDVVRTGDQAVALLRDLDARRASIPEDRPARHAQFFLLTEDSEDDSDFGAFAAKVQPQSMVFFAADYWRRQGLPLPVPAGEDVALAPRRYFLYPLDDSALRRAGEAERQ